MISNQLQTIISELRDKKIYPADIPEDFQEDAAILSVERELGVRTKTHCGYDVINNCFFVEENVVTDYSTMESEDEVITFDDFSDYYDYLEGDIYSNSCYYLCSFSEEDIQKYNLNVDLLLANDHFIQETIDDYCPKDLIENIKLPVANFSNKDQLLKEWNKKICGCKSPKRLFTLLRKCSELESVTFATLLIDCYIKHDAEKAFPVLMEIVNTGNNYLVRFDQLVLYYGIKRVEQALDYSKTSYSKGHKYRLKAKARFLFEELAEGRWTKEKESGFDPTFGIYYEKEKLKYKNSFREIEVIRHFLSFDEFSNYLNGDLSGCQLSRAPISLEDIKGMKTDEKTQLPLSPTDNIEYKIEKQFVGSSFVVRQILSVGNHVIEIIPHYFDYFFDFFYFLKKDLSNADLIMCDGFERVVLPEDACVEGIKARSNVLQIIKKSFVPIGLKKITHSAEKYVIDNEDASLPVYQLKRNSAEEIDWKMGQVSYISDLHLTHRLLESNCQNDEDVVYIIRKITDAVISGSEKIILIAGDTTHDFNLFCRFLEELEKKRSYHIIVFVLGNHELWTFQNREFSEICKKYKEKIEEHGMYLLQNSILYFQNNCVHEIVNDDLQRLSKNELRNITREASLLLFGGLAFSGKNESFNAENGIYRGVIDRNQEILESMEFEFLYKKVCDCFADKNVIIVSHTPKSSWSENDNRIDGFVYVNGHDHKNYYYDDGSYRVYADNQVGYSTKEIKIKSFSLTNTYDYYSDLNDGIYVINKDGYQKFCAGKGINVNCNWSGGIYMLKKNSYYCFIRKGENGKLCIFNGGQIKSLSRTDIEYYYEKMTSQIEKIKKPLEEYTGIQKRISDFIKSIGGSGRIHGAIVDVDFFNHVFVNPNDLTVASYYAADMIYKIVYDSFSSMLLDCSNELYNNYQKLLSNAAGNGIIPIIHSQLTKEHKKNYFSTDIYMVSRELKKMQRLNSRILTVWYEDNESPRLKGD